MASQRDIESKRQNLIAVYSGSAWKDKVKKMSPLQVVAIHQRLVAQGKIKI